MDKSSKVKIRCEQLMRDISLGKYQTTIYNKQNQSFQSSVFGGLLTFLFGSIIGVAVLFQVISVVSESHFNLDLDGKLIQAYV